MCKKQGEQAPSQNLREQEGNSRYMIKEAAKSKKSYNWELSSRPLTQHLMMAVVTNQKTESKWFTLKTYYKIGHRIQEMLHLDLFSSVSNVCIFPVFTGPPGEYSCPQKREFYVLHGISWSHIQEKTRASFFVISVHQLLRASNPKQLHQDFKDG